MTYKVFEIELLANSFKVLKCINDVKKQRNFTVNIILLFILNYPVKISRRCERKALCFCTITDDKATNNVR